MLPPCVFTAGKFSLCPGGGSRLGAASVDRLCCPERKGVPCCLSCLLAPSCRRAAYCPPGGGIGSNRSILLPYYYFRPCSLSPAIWGAAYYPRRWLPSGCCLLLPLEVVPVWVLPSVDRLYCLLKGKEFPTAYAVPSLPIVPGCCLLSPGGGIGSNILLLLLYYYFPPVAFPCHLGSRLLLPWRWLPSGCCPRGSSLLS